jgi:iron complex transport system permease protein
VLLTVITLLTLVSLGLMPLGNSPPSTFMLRLFRLTNAYIAGGCLSFSGLCFQHITKNNIVDPYITGIAPAAVLGMVIGSLFEPFQALSLELLFSLLAALLASTFAFSNRNAGRNFVLLGGIMIGGLCLTATHLLLYLNPSNTRMLAIYSSLYSNLETLAPLWGYIAFTLAAICALAYDFVVREKLQSLKLSTNKTASLGVSSTNLVFFVVVTSSVVTCLITATFGLIGFIGFITPNILRYSSLTSTKYGFIISIFVGGILLAAVDNVGRILIPPYGAPVGLITPLLGIPFLFYILRSHKLGLNG